MTWLQIGSEEGDRRCRETGSAGTEAVVSAAVMEPERVRGGEDGGGGLMWCLVIVET